MKEISETRSVLENSNSVKIFKGIIISCIITFLLLFVYAILLTYTGVSETTIGPVVIAITGVSILARKLNNNKYYKEKWDFKWRNNRFFLYNVTLYSIKYCREWLCT